MKIKFVVIPIASLLPLLAVIILAMFGIILSFWAYLLIALICPLVAISLWFIYKDMERKISNTGR